MRSSLIREQISLVALVREKCGYRESEANDLWCAAVQFVDALPSIVQMHERLTGFENELLAEMNPGVKVQLQPWGSTLVALPSNAPLPLAVIIAIAFKASGNDIMFCAPARVRPVVEFSLSLVSGAIGVEVASLSSASTRDTVATSLANRSISLLYFAGSSSAYADLAERCAASGVQLLFEGSGNSVTVVGPEADASAAVKMIERAKAGFNGKMCSAPNAVLVHESLVGELRGALNRMAGVELLNADSIDKATEHEFFDERLAFVAWADWDAVIQDLARLPYQLQVTGLGLSEHQEAALQQRTGFARYCFDMVGAAQDVRLPWGGYGRSGNGQPEDFFRKGLRRAVRESW